MDNSFKKKKRNNNNKKFIRQKLNANHRVLWWMFKDERIFRPNWIEVLW